MGTKLTPQERARLGGLARAHKAGKDGMAYMAAKGGRAVRDEKGTAHFVRMALRRHGRDVSL